MSGYLSRLAERSFGVSVSSASPLYDPFETSGEPEIPAVPATPPAATPPAPVERPVHDRTAPPEVRVENTKIVPALQPRPIDHGPGEFETRIVRETAGAVEAKAPEPAAVIIPPEPTPAQATVEPLEIADRFMQQFVSHSVITERLVEHTESREMRESIVERVEAAPVRIEYVNTEAPAFEYQPLVPKLAPPPAPIMQPVPATTVEIGSITVEMVAPARTPPPNASSAPRIRRVSRERGPAPSIYRFSRGNS
jgi:hypothetical protein